MSEYTRTHEHANEAQELAGQAARHPWVKNMARLGLAAIGLVYMLIGGLAIQLALGSGAGEAAPDHQTALQQIQSAPLGRFVLALIALGLFGYLIWRLTEAIADIEGEGNQPQGLAKRAGHAFSGLVYGSIGLQAGLLALGQSSGEGGSSQQEWSARFMSVPFGRWLVGIAGLLVIGYGLYQIYEAWQQKYRERFRYEQMSDTERRWIDPIARAGLSAHGIVLGLIGVFLIQAAYTFNPQEAQGLGGTLGEISRQPYGPWLLGLVALGLIAYGIYKLALARYHRVLARS